MRYSFAILLFFLHFLYTGINAQVSKFDSLTDELMFNLFTGKPDSIVIPFLKFHFPYLVKTPEPGGWTMYGRDSIPIFQHGMHSLKVNVHPFLKTEHTGARLDLFTQEWKDYPPGIEDARVWIYFDTKTKAEAGCSYIIKEFRKIGSYVDSSSNNNGQKWIIRESHSEDEWNSLSVTLQKERERNKFSVLLLFFNGKGDSW
jgi:hypothetical protein